jgi:hypothetical protein
MFAFTSSARMSVAHRTKYGRTRFPVTLRISAESLMGLASRDFQRARIKDVSWLMIALLALAVAAVIGAEWPRLTQRYGGEARRRRDRARRKASLTVIRTESDEFEEAVRRDLAELPTIEERDRKR